MVPNVDTGTATVIGFVLGIIFHKVFWPKIWNRIKPLISKVRARIGSI